MDAWRWVEPTHEDVYHGKADGAGGPAWVLPVMHTVHGPYVEVRAGSPDGELVRRIAAQHATHAQRIVQDLRDAMMRDGLDAIVGEVEPIGGRGRVDVHAASGGTLRPLASVDGVDPTPLCARIWLAPGRHVVEMAVVHSGAIEPGLPLTLREPRWDTTEVDIRDGAVIVMSRGRPVARVPWLHRLCALRRSDRARP